MRTLVAVVACALLLGLATGAVAEAPAASGDAAAAGGPPASPPKGAAEARATVERLNALYLDVMKNAKRLGYEGRYQRLDASLARLFDFPAMARLSVGSRWKQLDPEQQRELSEVFGRLTAATYARRFVGWGGERFEITSVEPSMQGTLFVRTRIELPEKPGHDLDYRLRETRDGWRILDVFFDGTVSELALRRSEYTAVLDRSGFDGLIATLQEQIADLASGKAAPPGGLGTG